MKEPRLDHVYTLQEAAEAMRMTPRGVAKEGKRHGLCMVVGRKILFTAGQLAQLQEALAWVSSSSSAARHAAAPSPDTAYARLLARAAQDARGPSASASPKLRKLALQRSKRPSAKKLLKQEFGE